MRYIIDNGSPAVGRIIQSLREERGITTNQLAKEAELSPSVITRWEKGERVPNLTSLVRVLDTLGADIFIMKR